MGSSTVISTKLTFGDTRLSAGQFVAPGHLVRKTSRRAVRNRASAASENPGSGPASGPPSHLHRRSLWFGKPPESAAKSAAPRVGEYMQICKELSGRSAATNSLRDRTG